MIKLIKNEYYKLLHKKSTYIMLGIILIFVILTNIIYKKMNEPRINNFYYSEEIKSLKKELNKNITDSEKANLSARLAEMEYLNLLDNNYNSIYYEFISEKLYQYYDELYVKKYNNKKLLEQINEYKEKISQDDWKFFVNLKLNNFNNVLNNMDKNNIVYKQNEYMKELNEYRLKNNVSFSKGYLNQAIINLEELIGSKIAYENAKTENERNQYKDAYRNFKINEYILKNKEDINNGSSIRAIFKNFFVEYLFLILVFTIMIAGSSFSEEFNKGTIKNLLTTPHNRSQIYVAKFITVIGIIPLVTLVTVIFELIVGGITFGFSSLSIPIVDYNFKINSLEIMNIWHYLGLNFIYLLPKIILLTTLAFALSIIICNTGASIVITICGFLGSNIINLLATRNNYKFLKYFVTPNWDLTHLFFGGTSPYNLSTTHSIIICSVYFLIMIIVSYIIFIKKDVKNI